MSVVYLDLAAIQEAQAGLRGACDSARSEAGRHYSLGGRVEQLLREMAGAILSELNPQRWFDPWAPWEQWGLGGLAAECFTSHSVCDDVRRGALQTVTQLAESQGAVVGGAVAAQAGEVGPALDSALGAVWDLANFFAPGNLLLFLTQPWVAVSRFQEVGNGLSRAARALEGFAGYLDRLWHREEVVLQDLLASVGPSISQVLCGMGAAEAVFVDQTMTSRASRKAVANMLDYLGQHFKADVNLFTHHAGQKSGAFSPSATLGLEGSLWESPTSEARGHLGSVPTEVQSGIAFGNLSAGVGAETLGKEGVLIGAVGSIAVVNAYSREEAGTRQLGVTNETTGKVLSADGFAGFHDGQFGADAGVSLATVQDTVGVNVAGVNVGLVGAVGLKAELGFEIGPETEIKLPFISFGFNFGAAK